MSTLRFLVVNLLKMYVSLICSLGFIFYLVAKDHFVLLLGGLLGIATVLFIGGYFLAKMMNPKPTHDPNDGHYFEGASAASEVWKA